jgi:hypothetical protein
MQSLGLLDRSVVWRDGGRDLLVGDRERFEAALDADAYLVNFNYQLAPWVVEHYRVSALVDIDPGLLQHWVAEGQLTLAPHTHHVTVGETVGTDRARFSDLGKHWYHLRPPVHLPSWPPVHADDGAPFTTVSGWWGGEWVSDSMGNVYDNNKRAAFLRYLDLPSMVDVKLELALNLDLSDDQDGGPDGGEFNRLLEHGWRVRHAYDVAADPTSYRAYVRASAGEFSAVKPSCRRFANAWISDRTVCYLASALPCVIEHTGPSTVLPDAEGLFRFRDLDDVVRAFAEIRRRPEHHRRAARRLVEEQFDAVVVLAGLLEYLSS